MAERAQPPKDPDRTAARPQRERAETARPSAATTDGRDPKGLLRVQAGAGNAAANLLVQRWTKGVIPGKGGEPSPEIKQWVKGVLPGAKEPPSWSKTNPTPGAKRGDERAGEHRDKSWAAVKEIQSGAASAAAAARSMAASTAWVVDRLAKTTAEGADQATTLDKEATTRLDLAKGFWGWEEPFGGANAAKQAEGVDTLWSKADALTASVKATHKQATWMGGFAGQAMKLAESGEKAVNAAGKGFGGGATKATDVHGASLAARAELRNARYDVKKHQAEIKTSLAAAQASLDKTTAAATNVGATKAKVWAPLKVGGGPEVVIGRLQQQLNATRKDTAKRVSITGQFTAPTEALLKAFQGGKVTGVADTATWGRLDTIAPAVRQSGQWVVMAQEGAKVQQGSFKGRGAALEGLTRPWISPTVDPGQEWIVVNKGPAVVELQQRLANWVRSLGLWARMTTPSPRPTGIYDSRTGRSLKAFQKAHGLAVNGDVGPPVWAALDAVKGKVTEGMVVHDELTEVEGQDRGQTIKYAWKATPGELKIIVRINFVPKDPMKVDLVEAGLKKDPADATKLHPDEVPRLNARMQTSMGLWRNDITRVWNGYTAKDHAPGSKSAPAKITFVPEVVTGGGDATVNVIPGPTADNASGRSDAANWFATDTSAGLAPHEFGHLIGLPDEYSRREEHFVRTTGTEPQIGNVQPPHKGFKAADYAIDIANKIKAAAPVAHAADPADPARKKMIEAARGKATAFATRVRAFGLRESAFGMAVSEEFANNPTAAAVSGGKDFPGYIVDLVSGFNTADDTEREAMWQVQGVYEAGLRAFLVSNDSVMGGATSVTARGKQLPIGHDHPVQPRHLQPYLKHLDWAWGGTWKVV